MANQSSTTKLDKITFRVFLTIFTVTGVAVLFSVWVFIDLSKETRRDYIQQHSWAVAVQISETVSYLYSIADHLTGSREMKDLLELGSSEEIEFWSVRTRKLFPNAVGMVLVNSVGDVIGSKSNQRVGRLCARDINIFVRNGRVLQPAVHQDNPDLQHFDIFRRINNDEDEMVGMLMISFHASMISETVKRHAKEGYLYRIHIGKDLFVEHGEAGPSYVVREKIPGTDWMLTVEGSDQLADETIYIIILGIILLGVLLGLLIFGIKAYLRRMMAPGIS